MARGFKKPLEKKVEATSRFRGVCFNRKCRRWQASTNAYGRYIYLGLYDSELAAARAYDLAVLRIRGCTQCHTNFAAQEYVDANGQLPPGSRLDNVISQLKEAAASQLMQELGKDDLALQHSGNDTPAGVVALIRQRVGLRRFAGLEQQLLLTLQDTTLATKLAGIPSADSISCEAATGLGRPGTVIHGYPGQHMSTAPQQLQACHSSGSVERNADDHAGRWQQQQAAAEVPLPPAAMAVDPNSAHNAEPMLLLHVADTHLQAVSATACNSTAVSAQEGLHGGMHQVCSNTLTEDMFSGQDFLPWLDDMLKTSENLHGEIPATPAVPAALDGKAAGDALLLPFPAPSTAWQSSDAAAAGSSTVSFSDHPVDLMLPHQAGQASQAGAAALAPAPVPYSQSAETIAGGPAGVPLHNPPWPAHHGWTQAAAGRHQPPAKSMSDQIQMGAQVAYCGPLNWVNISWLQSALPPHCHLQHVVAGAGLTVGLIFNQPSTAVPGRMLWGAAVWDGITFQYSQLCVDPHQAANECCSFIQQLLGKD
eukprot:gene9051-9221_t